ncbi:MAG TPA: trigger factor [Solirubrobacteraceae bacterium]
MSQGVSTNLSELADSRVHLDVEVEPAEVARALDAAAAKLGRDLRLPGFRKGKVPAPVVLGRLGREAVLDEAVRDRLGRWYAAAIRDAGVATVGDPELSLGELPPEGEPVRFSIEIGVRPVAKHANWRGLEVARRAPAVEEAEVERQIEQVRERLARLEPVERPATAGDYLVVDYKGTIDGEPIQGGEARAQLIELGGGNLIPGFEEGLAGIGAGEERRLELHFPEDYGAAELAGRDAVFEVVVGEVREKVLPELDDDFALDAAGFDTLEELREDIRAKLREADEAAVEREFREAVVDAASDAADVAVPEALAQARAREAWDDRVHALSHRGVSKEAFLKIAGSTEEEMIESARPSAERALRAEAVIAAIIAEEGIEPSDEELLETLERGAEPGEGGRAEDPHKLLAQLRRSGRLEDLRADVAAQRALDLLISSAVAISPERAAAREKLWTPGS